MSPVFFGDKSYESGFFEGSDPDLVWIPGSEFTKDPGLSRDPDPARPNPDPQLWHKMIIMPKINGVENKQEMNTL